MRVYLVFAVGIGNFESRKTVMQDYVRATNQKLSLLNSRTRIKDWYSSRNFVVEASDNNRMNVGDELSLALGTACATFTIEELVSDVAVTKQAKGPTSEPGVSWTRGIAFRVEGKRPTAVPKPTTHAAFFLINKDAVGVFKKDKLTEGEATLVKENRAGGWSAISADITKALGGTWTSRPLNMVEGTLAKARQYSPVVPYRMT